MTIKFVPVTSATGFCLFAIKKKNLEKIKSVFFKSFQIISFLFLSLNMVLYLKELLPFYVKLFYQQIYQKFIFSIAYITKYFQRIIIFHHTKIKLD